ncbi:MAG: class I SAM-dependent methyltransferase [Chloroflexi bacterium]|nr:class I SAM-dependent methyltransferase [Chloroflexota bacterium]
MISTLLFTWLQGADFYHDLHKQAVDLLPQGNGQLWLDIGSGPGLVSRLAAQRGYRVTGIDSDAASIQTAKLIAVSQGLSIEFKSGDVFKLPAESADVVSAASLLAVLPDREKGLKSLWSAVRAGGSLLIIEPTHQMNSENAARAIQNGLPKKRIAGLRMWANARQGNIVDPAIYETLGAESIRFTPLLQGLVGAWVIQKPQT